MNNADFFIEKLPGFKPNMVQAMMIMKFIYVCLIINRRNHKTFQDIVYLPALILNFFDLNVEVHRMPPTLRPFKYRSFGHFILTSRYGNP